MHINKRFIPECICAVQKTIPLYSCLYNAGAFGISFKDQESCHPNVKMIASNSDRPCLHAWVWRMISYRAVIESAPGSLILGYQCRVRTWGGLATGPVRRHL